MFDTQVVKFQISGPEDVSGLAEAVTGGRIQAADIQAIIAKTEGNGRVNDYSRPYALHSFEDYMMETLGLTRGEVQGMCAMVMSGGCEGIMSPHAVAFSKTDVGDAESPGEKRLSMGSRLYERTAARGVGHDGAGGPRGRGGGGGARKVGRGFAR